MVHEHLTWNGSWATKKQSSGIWACRRGWQGVSASSEGGVGIDEGLRGRSVEGESIVVLRGCRWRFSDCCAVGRHPNCPASRP